MDTSDDLSHIKVKVSGEVGTPFEGGNYDVEFVVPGDFPFNPPEVCIKWVPKMLQEVVCRNFLIWFVVVGVFPYACLAP